MRRRDILKFMGGLGLAGAGLWVYSGYYEPNNISVTELNLDLGIGVRVVFISDTHIDSSVYDVDAVIDAIGGLDPDYIFHTGDFLSSERGIAPTVDLLRRLGRLSDVYIVMGNHDHWTGVTPSVMKDHLSDYENISVLDNESIFLGRFWLVGVDDPYTYHDDLDSALAGVDMDYPRVLLAHSPQIVGVADGRVDLILAGHTHGGQVRLPFLGSIWLPLPRKYWVYDYGYFDLGLSRMFVTRGIGTTFLPIRFNCPPEVVLIHL